MSFPPLHHTAQNSASSGDSRASSTTGSARPRQSAWGLTAQSGPRRGGLTPLSTNVTASTEPQSSSSAGVLRRPGSSNSSSQNHQSSSVFGTSTFSGVLGSSNRQVGSRNTSNSSTSSPFTPLQTGSQSQLQGSSILSSPRSSSTTPFQSQALATSAPGSGSTPQGGGGGSGGPSRANSAYPSVHQPQSVTSPTTAAFDRGLFGSQGSSGGGSSGGSSQSSVSKIVVTQVFLLLGSITEKEGKAKWDSQAEAIRKLIDTHGMEVFEKYFRRLLVGNSPSIFPGVNRNVENPANYQLLVQEVEKASHDPDHARKVAEVISSNDGDTFRDFDLEHFVTHFNLDPIAQNFLASAFAQVPKPDLRTKAGVFLSTNVTAFVNAVADRDNSLSHILPSSIAIAAFRTLRSLPENLRDGTEKQKVQAALDHRYTAQNLPWPPSIRSAMSLIDVFEGGCDLAEELQRQGPQSTLSLESAREFLRRHGKGKIEESQIAGALLFMVLTPDTPQYRPEFLVQAIRDQSSSSINWEKVVQGFDRENLEIRQDQFLILYNALLPIADESQDFDIQMLWGGHWHYTSTQLYFALAFISLSSSQLDASVIPGLRPAWDPRDCLSGPEDTSRKLASLAEENIRDPMISLDAVTTIATALWEGPTPISPHAAAYAKEVVGSKTTFFVCSLSGMPKPWRPGHSNFLVKIFETSIHKQQAEYEYILHCLWVQDKSWTASRIIETHLADPIQLPLLLEHAQDHGWLDELCTMFNGFGIDLAALAHRRGLLDFDAWVQDKAQQSEVELVNGLSRFLVIKTQDEMRTLRDEQPEPRTVRLAMKTAHAMLMVLEENLKDRRGDLLSLERQCVQAFPRLINYGEGFDEIIEGNGETSNRFSEDTDKQMQDLFKRMYAGELEVRDIIENLRECKTSTDGGKQDLFACMISGLFDEYICFNEYPLSPLATTAVLFGGIIRYRLLSNIPLNVGLEMVLESVRDHGPDSSMFKFGLQALSHIMNRLPEWPDFCQQLVTVQALQGTEAYARAQDALRDDAVGGEVATNGVNGWLDNTELTNGDDIHPDPLVPQFHSVQADIVRNPERFQDPDETVQDRILFALNNITEQNLAAKFTDIADVLEPRHFQWFASYLVDQRAKVQPNYQQLYLNLLGMLGERSLWAEVLRETYVSIRRLINAESTMKSTQDRTHLKNLAQWLGALTLARDKPIKHKNISFKDLLLEGWETRRLLLVIPFTCEVLAQGAKSIVFKPPNPWLMDVIALLLELYDLPDLKIQQKFAVEVMLGALGLPRNGDGLERSDELQKQREMYREEPSSSILPDGLEDFGELSMNGLQKTSRNPRFSPSNLQTTFVELEDRLVFPPTSNVGINSQRLRQLVKSAVQRSILEIIGPVVERSVTIATIAAKGMIQKDFAQEPDESKVRMAFDIMTKSLAGSLSMVTCKEPLRASMTNIIRQAVGSEMPGENLAEGTILMCVTDNLEVACSLIEKQAEETAALEGEKWLELEIDKRRRHKERYPNEPYRDPIASHWSSYIAEPYKQMPGGLTPQQLDIYENFRRLASGPTGHAQNASQDSGKQIPDILQEAGLSSMPALPTPVEPPAVPSQTHIGIQHGQRAPPPNHPTARSSLPINGFLDSVSVNNHVQEAISDLARLTKGQPNGHLADLPRDHPIPETCARITALLRATPDVVIASQQWASQIASSLYQDSLSPFEVEVLVQLLRQICQLTTRTDVDTRLFLRRLEDDKFFMSQITANLLEAGLLDFSFVDERLAGAIKGGNGFALTCLETLIDKFLLSSPPAIIRADLVDALGALGELHSKDLSIRVKQLFEKVAESESSETTDRSSIDKESARQHQMQYEFLEWLRLYFQQSQSDDVLATYVSQLHHRQTLESEEDLVLFLRSSVDIAVDYLEGSEIGLQADSPQSFQHIDALAKLLTLLIKTREGQDGSRNARVAYAKSVLSMIVLVLNSHYKTRGETFNQRAFFRLFSTMLHEWQDVMKIISPTETAEMALTFAQIFMLLGPSTYPGFVYSWLGLISHRVFVPNILKTADIDGGAMYANLIETMLYCVGGTLNIRGAPKDLYRAALRVLLVLHHDFPEFLAENHFRLCNVISVQCIQLRNLVLSAFPSSTLDLPDPSTGGLKLDRMDEKKIEPHIANDFMAPLQKVGLKSLIDETMDDPHTFDETYDNMLQQLLPSTNSPSEAEQPVDFVLFHSIVLYIGTRSLQDSQNNTAVSGSSFSSISPAAAILKRLAHDLPPEARYYYLSAIVNQLRYPNSHTIYFNLALLHVFGTANERNNSTSEQRETDDQVKQQITRILLERLIVHRPHPWGLIITLLELLKNQAYGFWDLAFVQDAPEVRTIADRMLFPQGIAA